MVQPLARILITMLLGTLTAFGLFWVMQALIGVTGELGESAVKLSVDFVRLRRDNTPELKKREPPKREKPEQAPPPPEMNMAKAMNPSEAVGEIIPIVDTGMELEKATSLTSGDGGSDRDVVPLVRPEPEYPASAEARGIVGWVTVGYTIAKSGAVRDPTVIAARPPRIFDRAALAAIRRWKYNPKIVDGEAVERPGMQITFEFQP